MPKLLPDALRHALLLVADRLDEAQLTWAVTGSAALALRGFDLAPNDLDIELPEPSVAAASASLGWSMVERIDSGGRSVGAGGDVEGFPVEFIGGFTVRGPGGALPPDDDFIRQFSTTVELDGREVWVQPVEEYVVRAIVAGSDAKLDRVSAAAPAGFVMDETYVSLRLAAARAAR